MLPFLWQNPNANGNRVKSVSLLITPSLLKTSCILMNQWQPMCSILTNESYNLHLSRVGRLNCKYIGARECCVAGIAESYEKWQFGVGK